MGLTNLLKNKKIFSLSHNARSNYMLYTTGTPKSKWFRKAEVTDNSSAERRMP